MNSAAVAPATQTIVCPLCNHWDWQSSRHPCTCFGGGRPRSVGLWPMCLASLSYDRPLSVQRSRINCSLRTACSTPLGDMISHVIVVARLPWPPEGGPGVGLSAFASLHFETVSFSPAFTSYYKALNPTFPRQTHSTWGPWQSLVVIVQGPPTWCASHEHVACCARIFAFGGNHADTS